MQLNKVLNYHMKKCILSGISLIVNKSSTDCCFVSGVFKIAANCVSKVRSLSTIQIVSNIIGMSTLVPKCTGFNNLQVVSVPLGAMSSFYTYVEQVL